MTSAYLGPWADVSLEKLVATVKAEWVRVKVTVTVSWMRKGGHWKEVHIWLTATFLSIFLQSGDIKSYMFFPMPAFLFSDTFETYLLPCMIQWSNLLIKLNTTNMNNNYLALFIKKNWLQKLTSLKNGPLPHSSRRYNYIRCPGSPFIMLWENVHVLGLTPAFWVKDYEKQHNIK